MRKLLFSIFAILISISAYSQDIAQGAWRSHFNYQSAKILQKTAAKVFCATENGLFYVDQADNTINILTKTDGFSDVGISAMGYSTDQNILVLGYHNGNIDLFSEKGITNIDLIKNQNLIQDKKIESINVTGKTAYLSTDFGIVVLDLEREVIDEVYREIGPAGQQPEVFSTETINDSIFAITSLGFLGGKLSENINLLDFNNWRQISLPSSLNEFRYITSSDSDVRIASQNEIYSYSSGVFTLIGDQLNDIESIKYQEDGSFSIISSGIGYQLINNILSIIESDGSENLSDILLIDGALWLADRVSGLKKLTNGNTEMLSPNGPNSVEIQNILFQNEKVYAFGPFRNSGFSPINKESFSVFENGRWSTIGINGFTEVSDVSGKYFSSFGEGLFDSESNTVLSDTPLTADSRSGRTLITDIQSTEQGLWVANFNSDSPLHLLSTDGFWQSFNLDGRAGEITQFAASRNIWIRDNNNSGITIYNPESDEVIIVNSNNSDLPSSRINDIKIDLDDEVWVATDKGVAFFPSASVDISNFNTAILPIFENNFLFKDEIINSIAIDPGNRKWIGNRTGAWLLEEAGESLIVRFTAENSPLPSNNVLKIAVNTVNGEVFFVTDKGTASFRSDATESTPEHGKVKIFPNPVRPNFNGLVGINGLATDVRLKITDISGKLIREIEASGGGASWDLQDLNGNRARTGVYIIFSSDREGVETFVGKLAIVN